MIALAVFSASFFLLNSRTADAQPEANGSFATSAPLFRVVLAPSVAAQAHGVAEQPHSETLDGRVYIIVSRRGDVEPRLQGPGMDQDAPPIWGIDVDGLRAGGRVELGGNDSRVYGFPLPALKDLPEGQYFVQALMNVYETFHRSDGSVVKLHMPCGDGHRIIWSTGNIYSDVKKVNITREGGPIELELAHVIPPFYKTPPGGTCQQANLPESEHFKFLKFKSELLSRFWGRPMYIAASIILPRGYNEHSDTRYPVIFLMDHHPRAYRFAGGGNIVDVAEDGGGTFPRWWLGPDSPQVILVRPLSENPYYDTSYWVNSPNAGPYGDVMSQELLPEINRRFRTIDAPWARTLTGCSSGGWMAAAVQVYQPDLFGGAFVFAPDIVDLRSLWVLNLYEAPNAYWNQTEWRRWPRPYLRDDKTGNIIASTEEWAHLELAMGGRDRSGEYFAWQEATWGPKAEDGYPLPKWDPLTGKIDRDAVQQYRHYDISAYLKTNWAALEPKLRGGRLKFFVTETDNYYTNRALHYLQEQLAALRPASDAEFTFFPSGPHCGTPITQEQLFDRMAKFMTSQSPAIAGHSGPLSRPE